MRKLLKAVIAAGLILAVTGPAGANEWTGAATIRDETFYVPSSGLNLGPWTTIRAGTDYELSGYEVVDPFQINLEYQPGILDKDIANINTYFYPANAAFPSDHTDGTWSVNFEDNDEYLFNVSVGGGLTVYEYEGMAETVDPNIEWTLTAWHQTILAGDIVGNTLRVLPVGTYRPFVGDPDVNNVEVFDGNLDTEVLGYTFTGTAAEIGDGSSLGVILVPEPLTMLGVFLGVGGLGGYMRKRLM